MITGCKLLCQSRLKIQFTVHSSFVLSMLRLFKTRSQFEDLKKKKLSRLQNIVFVNPLLTNATTRIMPTLKLCRQISYFGNYIRKHKHMTLIFFFPKQLTLEDIIQNEQTYQSSQQTYWNCLPVEFDLSVVMSGHIKQIEISIYWAINFYDSRGNLFFLKFRKQWLKMLCKSNSDRDTSNTQIEQIL